MAALGEVGARRIVVVGGGAANALLNQLVADAAALPVATGPVEATAIGNALMQHAALEGVASAAPLRALVRNSTPSRDFEPDATMCARFDEAAARVARPDGSR